MNFVNTKESDFENNATNFTKFKNKLVAKDIFKKSRENSPNEKKIVDEFINNRLRFKFITYNKYN